jgi:hypothetical protein
VSRNPSTKTFGDVNFLNSVERLEAEIWQIKLTKGYAFHYEFD